MTGLGLYDGFEGYRTPTDEDIGGVLKSGLVVVDTNALLNLYRYNDTTRQTMLAILAMIGDRLWIPHQVAREFWRNRESALRDSRKSVDTARETLRKARENVTNVVSQLRNRGVVADDDAGEVLTLVATTFDKLVEVVAAGVDEARTDAAINTEQDEVLTVLVPLLDGRVGAPMDDETYAAALVEAKRRAAAGEPPGFEDADKDEDSDRPAGDYLVWKQTLIEAASSGRDVVFVTGDVKGDWWRLYNKTPRGPRNELVQEFARETGHRLFLLRPEQLLTQANRVLEVDVPEASLRDVERVEAESDGASALSAWGTDKEAPNGGGWTRDAIHTLITRLRRIGADVQASVIIHAIGGGGFITRDEIYEIGHYEETRQLKGFTRPVNRLSQDMRDNGEISADAVSVLVPVYDEMARGFGWVDGFSVPNEIVALFE